MNSLQNKILFTGCSYSCGEPSFPYEFAQLIDEKERPDFSLVKSYAYPGQSNSLILKKVYDAINEENWKNALFVCQLTFLHRKGEYHDITNSWVDYQPEFIKSIPMINETDDSLHFPYHIDSNKNLAQSFAGNIDLELPFDTVRELKIWYETYLKYIFNEKETFKFLMCQIDLLRAYVESKNSKIVFIYWPEINNMKQVVELKKRNFFNINNEYSMLKYTTKNNLCSPNDSHLSEFGMKNIAKELYNFIYGK